MSHQFFEPEMGLSTPPAHFQQKKAKQAKKNFWREGGKFHFLSRQRKFPLPGQEMEFSSRYLKFFFFFLFLLKMGGRGWKTHFWFKKLVGHFF
mgnify:CR=1 FL=1